MVKLTNTLIEAAIHGFEAQKKSLDAQIAELRALLGGTPDSANGASPSQGSRRKFSAASRQRMREAQQRRWAKIKGESTAPATTTPTVTKPKRRLSAAG